MADCVEGAGFWLPSEFFDDFLTEKENFVKNKNAESDSNFCFPTEFPYDFGKESDECLEKCWVISTSPQSTLAHGGIWSVESTAGSGNGSPNGAPSPPTTPLGAQADAVGELIYRAAGQVAKLKLNGADVPRPTEHKALMGPPASLGQLYPAAKSPNQSAFQNIHLQRHIVKQQKPSCEMWYSEPQMYQIRRGRTVGGMVRDAWSIQHNPTHIVGSGTGAVALGGGGGGGAAVKRERTGTGVFLPRRYGSNSDGNAYSRKNTGFAFVPERNAHVLNKNLGSVNGFAQAQPHCHPKCSRGFVSNYDLLMARRDVLLLQIRQGSLPEKSCLMRRGEYLPQEWTY